MNKINKVVKAASVAFAGFFALSATAATEIGTAEAFVAAMNNDPAGDYVLTADIDLTGSGYATTSFFSGTLDGAGHTITGLGANSLFDTFSGSIKNLTLDGTVSDKVTTRTATNVGMFCNKSYAGKFYDIVLKGYCLKLGSLNYQNGLFAAYAYDGSEFHRCMTDVSCSMLQNGKANSHQGGLVGRCAKKLTTAADIVFEDCTNNAAITSTGNYNSGFGDGGIIGYFEAASVAPVPTVILRRCINNGTIKATGGNGQLGGLVGMVGAGSKKETANRLIMIDCVNNGEVTATAYQESLGGLVGRGQNSASGLIDGCVNNGIVNCTSATQAGGLVGYWGNYMSTIAGANDLTIQNCANHANVSGKYYAAGLVGKFDTNTGWASGLFHVYNSANYGALTATDASGYTAEIAGLITYNTPTTNAGHIDNCWGKTTTLYGKIGSRTPTVANCKSLEDTTALADLNAVVAESNQYLPWVAGTDTYPHLEQFADTVPANVTVAFRDWDGTVLKKETVAKGGTATPPENPARDYYTFSKWVGDYANVAAFTSVHAAYVPNDITITFDAEDGVGGTTVETKVGSYVIPPTVTLSRHEFAGWSYDGKIVDYFASSDVDKTFKAVWRKVKEPYAYKISYLTWHLKSCDKTSCEARGNALKEVFDAYNVDIATIVGLSRDSTQLGRIIALLPGYSYTTTWQNGSSDGSGRTIFWKTSRFEQYGSASYSQPSSNSTTGYVPLKRKGRHQIFLPMAAFYNTTQGVGTYLNNFKTHRTTLEASYPTAIHLLGADYANAPSSSEFAAKCGTWEGMRDYFSVTNGYTTLQASEDYQWAFIKSPWSSSGLKNITSAKVENSGNQSQPGYVTTFQIGYPDGFGLIVR